MLAIIIWAILAILILLGIVAIVVSRKKKRPTDYYSLFVIGLVWFAIGLPLRNFVLGALGFIFMITGLVNRKKWGKNRKTWRVLTKSERKIRIIIITVLIVLIVLGLIALLMAR
jgi:hypothetical protein